MDQTLHVQWQTSVSESSEHGSVSVLLSEKPQNSGGFQSEPCSNGREIGTIRAASALLPLSVCSTKRRRVSLDTKLEIASRKLCDQRGCSFEDFVDLAIRNASLALLETGV